MMVVAAINTCTYGSTGKIMLQIFGELCESDRGYVCVPNGRHNKAKYQGDHIWIGGRFSEDSHIILGRLTGLQGCFSYFATLRFLRKLRRVSPDVIHLHNLHNSYINLPLLFGFIKKHRIPVVWTLHDCWSFTGHCPYFTMSHCDRWMTGCHDCPSYRAYPASVIDSSRLLWKLKKKWFTRVESLTLVTPSQWLADLARRSYLAEYPVKVINNGIDLSVFKPTESNFRERYGIPDNKKIILGVAFDWERRKGLDVFTELAHRLPADDYQIVLVGTNEETDKELPAGIISIHRTHNQQELAAVYTAADVLLNPTREDNYPTVNMEAIACGTPVLTFRTGGSPESITPTTGAVVDDDIDTVEREVIRLCRDNSAMRGACLEAARDFDMNKLFKEYVRLYRTLDERTESNG